MNASSAAPRHSQASSLIDVTNLPFIETTMIYGMDLPGVETYIHDSVNPERSNLELERRPAKVYDVRSIKDSLSYRDNGFQLVNHRSKAASRANDQRIEDDTFLATLRDEYMDEMRDVITSLSGSSYVFSQPYGFFVRHGKKSKVKTWLRPAGLPHIDLTLETASKMAELIRSKNAPNKQFSRFAVYQSWRAVSPRPYDNTLCFCDGRMEISKDKRLVESIMGPRDQPDAVYMMDIVLYNPKHEWLYFSDLADSEVIVFQGYDVQSPHPMLHSSFNTGISDALPRVSLESRHYAFFE